MTEAAELSRPRNEVQLFLPFRATFFKATQEILDHKQQPSS